MRRDGQDYGLRTNGLHACLKAGTAAWHERVDASLSRLDLARGEDYARFLSLHERTTLPIEHELEDAGIGQVLADWPARRRSAALLADMEVMRIPHSALRLDMGPLRGLAQLAGAAYVLEGSRLGGRILARQVAEGYPAAFLSHGAEARLWGSFLDWMDTLQLSPRETGEAVETAKHVFRLYEAASASSEVVK